MAKTDKAGAQAAAADAPDASGPIKQPVAADGAAAVADAPARIVPLSADRWKFGDFGRTIHTVTVPAGTDFETVCRPEYWGNLTRMTVDDIIQIGTDDRAWFAELIVIGKARNSATVAVLRAPVALSAAFKPEPGAVLFDVQYAGAHGKWRVIRKSDRAVMKDRCESESEARKWVEQYERLVAA